MRSKIKLSINLFLLLFFITSCGSKFSLQKRRYTKGFHFSVVKDHGVKRSDVIADKSAETQEAKSEIVSGNPSTVNVKEEQLIVVNTPEANKAKKDASTGSPTKKRVEVKGSAFEEQEGGLVKMAAFENEENSDQGKGAAKSFSKTNNKRFGLFDVVADIYIGYYVIVSVVVIVWLLYTLFKLYSFAQLMPYLVGFAIFLIVCYLVGSLFNGGF